LKIFLGVEAMSLLEINAVEEELGRETCRYMYIKYTVGKQAGRPTLARARKLELAGETIHYPGARPRTD
jgi:hypothetical protein